MSFKSNTFSANFNFIAYYQNGLSLKSRALRICLQRRGVSQKQISEVIGIPKQIFRWRLYHKQKFTREEITRLVYFIGARAALKVLWFPTVAEKLRVSQSVKSNDTESIFCKQCNHFLPSVGSMEKYGEFYGVIFSTKKLPDDKFFKRREICRTVD